MRVAFAAMFRALRAAPRALAGTLAIAHSTLPAARCAPNAEEVDMLNLVKTAGGTEGQYAELRAIGLGTPLLCLSASHPRPLLQSS